MWWFLLLFIMILSLNFGHPLWSHSAILLTSNWCFRISYSRMSVKKCVLSVCLKTWIPQYLINHWIYVQCSTVNRNPLMNRQNVLFRKELWVIYKGKRRIWSHDCYRGSTEGVHCHCYFVLLYTCVCSYKAIRYEDNTHCSTALCYRVVIWTCCFYKGDLCYVPTLI